MSFTAGTDVYGRGVGRYGGVLAKRVCDEAAVGHGDTALDVGCGPGPLLAELAARLGADRVAGIDPSVPFVEIARSRIPTADIRVGPGEDLPFEDASFDVVVSQLALNFMADPRRALSEMRRVANRTVAACVWDYADGMTMLRAFWDAALELDPAAPDEGVTMRYCTSAELTELWSTASFDRITSGSIVVHADYEDFADYWSPFPTGLAPSGAYCASLDPDRREALRNACFRRLGVPDAGFRLSARAWFIRGEL